MLPLETSFSTKYGSKYKENGHIFGPQLISAITFYRKMRFWNRFHWWSAFFNLFKTISILTISYTTILPYPAIMAIFQFWPLWPPSIWPKYGNSHSQCWCHLKEQKKCRSPVKTVSKRWYIIVARSIKIIDPVYDRHLFSFVCNIIVDWYHQETTTGNETYNSFCIYMSIML